MSFGNQHNEYVLVLVTSTYISHRSRWPSITVRVPGSAISIQNVIFYAALVKIRFSKNGNHLTTCTAYMDCTGADDIKWIRQSA